jgi:hypothetical protein
MHHGWVQFFCRETFRLRARYWLLFGVIFLAFSKFAESSEYLPFIVRDADFRTNLLLNNLAPETVQVQVTLLNNDGTTVSQDLVTIPSLGFHQINDVVLSLLGSLPSDGFSGHIVVESATPIRAFASQIDNLSHDPAFIQSRSSGGQRLLIASTTSVYPYRSGLAILNLAQEYADVELKLRNGASELLATLTKRIPPRGQIVLSDLHREMGIERSYGPLEIISKTGQPLLALSRVTQIANRSHGFISSSFLEGEESEFLIPFLSKSDEDRTNITLCNPHAESQTVQLVLAEFAGSSQETKTISIPPDGLIQLSLAMTFALAEKREFLGSLRVVSQLPVLGFASIIKNETGDPSFLRILPEGSSRLLIPSSTNLPPYVTEIIVVNTGELATSIALNARSQGGSSAGKPKGYRIPGRGQLLLQKPLEDLNLTNWFGPLEIVSLDGQPLRAVAQVKSTVQSNSDFLEALDTTPRVQKRVGEEAIIAWNYDPAKFSEVVEFRIYLVEKRGLNYRLLQTLPKEQDAFRYAAQSTGTFIFVVKAFNGVQESPPSAEVMVEVSQ